MRDNIRKYVVGDSFSYCIKYVVGSEYKIGVKRCKLTSILQNKEHPEAVDIYVEDENSQFIWKTIFQKPLEIEYDVNFS